MYAQGYVKGLSPYEYRGKSPSFYKQRLRENSKPFSFSTTVEENYRYLVPSKWHKTGWKYTKLPDIAAGKVESPSEFMSSYSLFFQPHQTEQTPKAKKPKDSLKMPFTNLRRASLRRN